MDMLVKLYNLPDVQPYLNKLKEKRIEIRPAWSSEKRIVANWVGEHFGDTWEREVASSFEQRPPTTFLATLTESNHTPRHPYDLPKQTLLGFATYDAFYKGMFGPTGVREDYSGLGIGTALLLVTLQAMYANWYAYAVIGWTGPVDFYAKAVGATIIPDSEPGIFRGPLK